MTVETLVSTPVTALLQGVAIAAFTAAAVTAAHNYRRTKSISNYWLVFTIAVTFGAVFAAMDLLALLGTAPELLSQLDHWVAILFIFSLILTAVETLTSSIEIIIE